MNGIVGLAGVVETLERHVDDPMADGTTLLRAETEIGRYELGEGNAVAGVLAALAALDARRAILVSEPRAWEVAGAALADGLIAAGIPVDRLLLPEGEAAKRMPVVERAASELARLRAERGDPLVAIGGGALGDTAGFLAATWLRGVPVIHVPTTLVAQIDSSIGGKTAVDLPEGKNLVGAFHQAAAVIVDVRFLRTLPARQLRAALGEAAKMAALGDERLFELLEGEGAAIAGGAMRVHDDGTLAEVVERCGWAKIEVVTADEREQGDRINLNLGHSLAHAIEAAAGYEGILHGEAVAYGLRAACRIGVAVEATPPERAARIEVLLDALDLGRAPLPYPLAEVLAVIATDKKHAGGRLRWVLPAATGVTIRSDVPDEVVEAAARGVLAGSAAEVQSMSAGERAGAGVGPGRRLRVLVVNGPNLDLLGTREPAIYGRETLAEINAGIAARAAELGVDVAFFQSNHEGALIDRLHRRDFDASIVNAGGLTHTSVSMRDALLGIERPFVEVHLSDPATREPFRRVNFLEDVALARFVGMKTAGYHRALEELARRWDGRRGRGECDRGRARWTRCAGRPGARRGRGGTRCLSVTPTSSRPAPPPPATGPAPPWRRCASGSTRSTTRSWPSSTSGPRSPWRSGA